MGTLISHGQDDAPILSAEVTKDEPLKPYPDAKWNRRLDARANELPFGDYLVCAQSIMLDGHGNLWVMDAGAPGNAKILECAPKLVRIDVKTDQVTTVISFPQSVALKGSPPIIAHRVVAAPKFLPWCWEPTWAQHRELICACRKEGGRR